MLALTHLNDDGTTVATPATDANAATPAPSTVTTSSSATATTVQPEGQPDNSTPAANTNTTTPATNTTPPGVAAKNASGTCPTGFLWTDPLRKYDCVACPAGSGYDSAQGVCVLGATVAPNAPGTEPFYKNWKFWAIVGGVVVAGTTTAVLLRRRR